MNRETIEKTLLDQQDIPYRDFQAKLIPDVPLERMIGIRTPALRSMAKMLSKDPETEAFLLDLPHRYFEENQLHAFIISETRPFATCLRQVEAFLPFVDNWATCDQMSPKVFKKHRQELLPSIRKWLGTEHTYTVRFGIKMLMEHFLDEDFSPEYPEWVGSVHSDAYYINMMIAWYFATALAKQYDAVIPWIEQKRLDPWTHNKTIQKAVESYRITEEQKAYLRTWKVRAK